MPQLQTHKGKTLSQFYEKALNSGLKRYSPTMQWVTTPVEGESERCALYTIDNIAFIYALLASKKADNVVSACRHLAALLPFASDDGSFPDYLHQYPGSQGYYTTLHVHHALALIMKYFAGVIAPSLREAICACQEKGKTFFSSAIKRLETASFKKALMALFSGKAVDQVELEQALKNPPHSQDQLLYLFMLNQHTPELDFLSSYLNNYYDAFFERPLSGDYPLLLEGRTVYNDLPHYLINYYRLDEDQLTRQEELLLRSALFMPFDGEIASKENKTHLIEMLDQADISRPGMGLWRLHYREDVARYCLAVERGVRPDGDPAKSKLAWHLPAESFEDRENQEIVLYLNLAGPVQALVRGEKTTLFQLGESVDLCSNGRKLSLSFHVTHGKGDFTGQIAYGNRASQKKPFQVGDEPTDYIIAIKTLRRDGDVTITMHYSFQEEKSP